MNGTVPGIPGIKSDGNLPQQMKYEVKALLNRDRTTFPGAQPVSFAAKHFRELQQQDYYVCEKSDGVRCLMYLTHNGNGGQAVYLIDRKNDYYWIDNEFVVFPKEENRADFHVETIVDGELVNDVQPDGTLAMRYLVFDCLVLDGNSLKHRTLDKRLAYFRDKVFKPYETMCTKRPDIVKRLPFIVKFKQMEFSYALDRMFNEILPKLPHGNDGLIFTCRNTPYVHGTDEHILKWKPEDENTIDFRMHLRFPMIDADSDDEDKSPYPNYHVMPQVSLSVYGGDKNPDHAYGTMLLEQQKWEEMKSLGEPLDDRVVECFLDKENSWRFLRFRDDKLESNHISTVQSVMESIQDKVSKDDLIRHSMKIREEWKKRQAMADVNARKDQEANARKEQEARARKEQEARKAAAMSSTSDASNGTKRKHEGEDAIADASMKVEAA